MNRIIIVGGSGFLGQELLRALSGQAMVIDITPSKEECEKYIEADITKPLDFTFLKDDIVVHLAANQYHHKVPRKNRQYFFDSVNVEGTRNILKKMEQDGAKKMVFFSTDMVYGIPQYLPVDIQHPKVPFGFYGKSKIKAEDVCREYRDKGFNITIFRPRMIVGKGRFGILVKLFKMMDMGLPIPMIGGGGNCYQMISVTDCANVAMLAINKGLPNKEYNLGSDNPPSVKHLLNGLIKKTGSHSFVLPTWGRGVKAILTLLGKIGIEIMYKEQYMIADKDYLVDISDAMKDFDWKPKSNDQDMLLAAYESYKEEIK
jgi:dTDP-glucose 4,6-dehydratase